MVIFYFTRIRSQKVFFSSEKGENSNFCIWVLHSFILTQFGLDFLPLLVWRGLKCVKKNYVIIKLERKTLHSPLIPLSSHLKHRNDQIEGKALHMSFVSTQQRENRSVARPLHEIPHLCSYPSDQLITFASWNLWSRFALIRIRISFSDRKAGIFLHNCKLVINELGWQ